MPSEESSTRVPKIYLWIHKGSFRDEEKSGFQQWETTKALGSASVPVMRMISQVGVQGRVSTVGTRHKTCLSSRYPRSLVSRQRVPKLVSLEGTRDEDTYVHRKRVRTREDLYHCVRYPWWELSQQKVPRRCRVSPEGTRDEACLSSRYPGTVVSSAARNLVGGLSIIYL